MNKKMLWIVITLVAIAVVTVPVAACESGCWLTAGGHITNLKGVIADFKGSYGGNGMTMKDGPVRGEWNHVDHLPPGAHFHGDVTWLTCDHQPYPGPDVPKAIPNHVMFGGEGTLDGVDGCEFRVDAYDINEGGIHRDGYEIWVECPDGSELHNKATSDQCNPLTSNNPIGCLAGGNIQIHPPNNGHP